MDIDNIEGAGGAGGEKIPDVVTVGEAMALLMACQPGPLAAVRQFERATAGAELNVSVGLSRLGYRVGYVSRLGKDSLARNLLDFMAAEGIDLRHVRQDERYPTGFMLKSMALDGSDPEVEYFRRGSAASHMSRTDIPSGPYQHARLLHLTGISPALSDTCRDMVLTMAAQARGAGRLVTFDPNLRPRLWPTEAAMVETVNTLAGLADIVMPGLAEGKLLTGCAEAHGIADFYLARGARQVVVKLGPQGAYYASAEGRGVAPGAPVPPANVVDTVGAGDGFAVGVISALLEDLPLAAAAARGNAIGARVVQYRGDCEGLPTRAQLGLR
ncbi:2-dehydro-3-deoxygluconokinase [Massilia sp. Root351]|jgi:2-dehydro-3-deoxygluconokinase|uniref:sugar kinase n=1 Tax=Massilia sp. Root351 TaxID=1736522 RepID=UPI00071126DD|nr:sugar kinase [Massilia sp. Root351]KQV82278.1 2-dehydro-3-deoxygluconokinase [Massilia sp. Root351]